MCSVRCNTKSHFMDTAYILNSCEILSKDIHKDLGVMISSELTFEAHYNYIVSRAYQTLGLLRRTFSSKTNVKEKRLLYIAVVRSQFIYCSPVWRPYLLKDINFLKCVQRCATKYMLNDFRSDYKSKLIALSLLPLMYIFELSGIMFCVRSLKSPTKNFNISEFIHFSKCGTRSTAMKMSHSHFFKNFVRYSFFNRIPRLWNSLPPIHLKQSSESIKRHLHKFLYDHFLVNFNSNHTCSFHFLCPCAKCSFIPQPPHF